VPHAQTPSSRANQPLQSTPTTGNHDDLDRDFPDPPVLLARL
jgi:hypothetical protein